MEEVLKEISYFKGITYYISEFCNLVDPLPDCVKTNFTHYANLVSTAVIFRVQIISMTSKYYTLYFGEIET